MKSARCVAILLLLALTIAVRGATPSPKVMLLVDEKSLGTIPTAEVEAMAISMLRDRQVRTVDQEMVRSNVKKSQAMLKSVGDNRGAAAIGLQFGADVIIVGEAVAKPSARRIAESNLRTYQAVVTLRAVRTDNSENLATASETASIVDIEDVSGSSKALKTAGQKTLQELLPTMLESWEKGGGSSGSSTHIVLSVGGVDQAWKLKAIRELLRGKSELIQNVQQKSYTAGAAVFEVDSEVPAETLSEKIVLAAPQGLSFQVLDVAKGKIDLRAVAK